MVKNYAHLLAAPVTAIFNSSFSEGKLPDLWKTATVVPVPKKHPPGSLESDIRPISLTPILAKVVEAIVLNWVHDVITPQIYERQFGGLSDTGTTDALVEMVHCHVVRGYRQVRYFRTSAPCRLQQSVRSHQPRNTHFETVRLLINRFFSYLYAKEVTCYGVSVYLLGFCPTSLK